MQDCSELEGSFSKQLLNNIEKLYQNLVILFDGHLTLIRFHTNTLNLSWIPSDLLWLLIPIILNIQKVCHIVLSHSITLIYKWLQGFFSSFLSHKIQWLYLNFYQLSYHLSKGYPLSILHHLVTLIISLPQNHWDRQRQPSSVSSNCTSFYLILYWVLFRAWLIIIELIFD